MTFLKTVSPTFKSVGKSIESSKRAKRVKKPHKEIKRFCIHTILTHSKRAKTQFHSDMSEYPENKGCWTELHIIKSRQKIRTK